MFIKSFHPLSKQSFASIILMLLPLCGMWHIGHAAYIHVKANLAQVLLESAWQDTLKHQAIHKPWPWADTWPVAKLRVPALKLHRIVLAGANGSALAFGPGRLFLPGEQMHQGNTIIAGHRDTHFAFLRDLELGDVIELENSDNTIKHYQISNIVIADENDFALLQNNDQQQLNLITCYPFTDFIPGGPLRYVVQAYQVADKKIEI